MNLTRRLKKLESRRYDATGLVPRSEAWFAFWENQFDRLVGGDDIGGARIPIEVVHRMVEEVDREALLLGAR
jgi:hypothetical protein